MLTRAGIMPRYPQPLNHNAENPSKTMARLHRLVARLDARRAGFYGFSFPAGSHREGIQCQPDAGRPGRLNDNVDVLCRATIAQMAGWVADPNVVYTTVPMKVMDFAAFPHRVGRLKRQSDRWTDMLFEESQAVAESQPQSASASTPCPRTGKRRPCPAQRCAAARLHRVYGA